MRRYKRHDSVELRDCSFLTPEETILRTYFTKRNVLWACAIVLIVWVASTILLDEKVSRSELPDDSIIFVMEEHRFKVPIVIYLV